MLQCKLSLYLKKAGLASRNIVHFLKKVILRCIGLCFHYHHLYLLSRLDQPLIQRIPAGLSSTVACLDISHICVLSRDTKMAAGNGKKTSGVQFCQKRGLFRKFRQMFLLILTLFRMLKIGGRVILKIRNSSFTAALLMSRTMKIRKLKLFYCQKNARYRAKELCRDIFLGNLSLKEDKNSVGLPVLILEFW